MQKLDKRLMPRLQIGETAPGSLTLLSQGQKTAIMKVRNISESGMSFFVNSPMEVSEKIGVGYADAHVNVEVFGRIAWCSQVQHTEVPAETAAGDYLVGVELFSPMMLYAVLPKR